MTIAEAVQQLVLEGHGPYERYIWKGDPDLLHEAHRLARGQENSAHHPITECDYVMQAVSRSPLFEKVGYIRACTRTGRVQREVKYAAYMLRKQAESGA